MRFFHRNALKDVQVFLSAGSSDPDFPLWRIYDSASVLFWAGDGSASDYTIKIDGTPITIEADSLILHNHNLAGAGEMKLVGIDGSGLPGDEFIVPVTGEKIEVHDLGVLGSYRQWEIRIIGLLNPVAGEISLCRSLEVAAFGGVGSVSNGYLSNIEYKRSVGGFDVATRLGPSRWWQKTEAKLTPNNHADFIEFLEGLEDYLNPFYVISETGDHYLVRFEDDPTYQNAVSGSYADEYWQGPLNIIQVF